MLLDCCSELCVRSSGAETNRNDRNMNYDNETESQYVNTVALQAAASDEQARATNVHADKCEDSMAVYQDLSMDATGSAAPAVYEKLKPRAPPKPRPGHSKP